MRPFILATLLLTNASFAQNLKVELHCTQMDYDYGYPAVVNILLNEATGEKFGQVYVHDYVDTEEAHRAKLTRIDQNGPETWYYGEGFELRYDPTVGEGTLFEGRNFPQVELYCQEK